MKTVEMDKGKLIEVVKGNLAQHKDTYDKAVVAYRAKQHELLEELLKQAENGEPIDHWALSRMPVPENHTTDYYVVLEMLNWEVGDTVELTQQDFRRYVRDEWEWRQHFLENTASYLVE